MTDVHQLPRRVEVEKQAADWIARLNSDDVTDADRAGFEVWRRAHVLHARTYDEMIAAWRSFRSAGPVVRAVSFGQSMNEAAGYGQRRSYVLALSLGAAASSAAIAIALVFLNRSPETEFRTAIGARASVALADGSAIELNSNSAVHVLYSTENRVIHLERGEAYFNAAHDALRPFWVVAGGSRVRALGTAFNVYVRPDGVRITVSEGAVQVAQSSSESGTTVTPASNSIGKAGIAVLRAGDEADLHGNSASIHQLPESEVRRATAWRTGKLYFDREPLASVIDELSRYTAEKLILSDHDLGQLKVGGTFQASPKGAETLLSLLQDGFGLKIRREPGLAFIENNSTK